MKRVRFAKMIKPSGGIDRISSLPDELIHHILSFSDVQSALQTSLLSKRWKFIWTNLPFLNFLRYHDDKYRPLIYFSRSAEAEFFERFFSRRNHQSQILKLNLAFQLSPSTYSIEHYIEYAVLHNVVDLDVCEHGYYEIGNATPVSYFDYVRLCTFSSTSIKKLKLRLNLGELLDSKCWDLPVLTTLYLKHDGILPYNLQKSYFTCLPCLQTLTLSYLDLPESISLPGLTTLYLINCKLPIGVWDLPALLTLQLDAIEFPECKSDFFSALVSLQNLTLSHWNIMMTDFVIDCPQIVNLEINGDMIPNDAPGKIIFKSRKICNFSYVGFFRIRFGVSELENVNINLRHVKTISPLVKNRVRDMFYALRGAKILTLDLETIEAFSVILDFLVNSSSPFYNLKYVKVPQEYKESSMSSDLRCYLLGRSPKATIITTFPQNNTIPPTEVAPVTDQNVVLQEPLSAPTKVWDDSEKMCKTLSIDTVDMGVQEEHVVQNSAVDVHRVGRIGAPVERTGNNQVSSSRCNNDFGFWRGHEVNSEFVCLLDLIMNKYPETFEHFTTKNKKFCTMKLNLLCTSVNDFTGISMTDVDTKMIAEYRDVFAELQKFGFNVSWLVSRLNYIEQVRFSQPLLSELHAIDCHIENAKSELEEFQSRVDNTKTKLQDLVTLRAEKMQEIQKAFGTMVTNLVVGYIGDNLLSSP